MDKSIKDKLLSCRSYDDARPILETHNAGVAVHKLFSTGYGVQAKQPTVARDFFNTAIQELEDEEDEKKKIAESDGGKSEQSSSTTGLEKVGSESDAAESFHAQADKKDQMGVAINEAFPPQQPGGMPPQGQCPQPPQQQQMGGYGGQPPMQPQQPPQMNPQQQMQYTINESIRTALKPMQEAIKALDKKIQETQKTQPTSLEIGSQLDKKSLARIRETTGNKNTDLTKARQDITRMNDFINSGN